MPSLDTQRLTHSSLLATVATDDAYGGGPGYERPYEPRGYSRGYGGGDRYPRDRYDDYDRRGPPSYGRDRYDDYPPRSRYDDRGEFFSAAQARGARSLTPPPRDFLALAGAPASASADKGSYAVPMRGGDERGSRDYDSRYSSRGGSSRDFDRPRY